MAIGEAAALGRAHALSRGDDDLDRLHARSRAAGDRRRARRRSAGADVGTSVFAGMLAASSIGIFLIPMLYVVFQRLREWGHAHLPRRARKPRPAPGE